MEISNSFVFISKVARSMAHWSGRLRVLAEIIIVRFGFRRNLVRYETLLAYIDKYGLWDLNGDLLEIGAFMGGGTRKLAERALQHRKRVTVIDVFEPNFDQTFTIRGESVAWIYQRILGRRDLRLEFNKSTHGLTNLAVYAQDSRLVQLPTDRQFVFSFIDGNHSSEYVLNDFKLAWSRTTPNGVVAFHDYGDDLPQVKNAIDQIIQIYREEISMINIIHSMSLILLHK